MSFYVSYAPVPIPFLPSCCLEYGCYITDQEKEGHTRKMVEWESEGSYIRCCLTNPELSSSRLYMRNKLLHILATSSMPITYQCHQQLVSLSELQILCPAQTN